MKQILVPLLMTALLISSKTNAADGGVDRNFGMGGKVTTTVGTSSVAYSMSVQSDGKIIVTGNSSNGNSDDFTLVRYNLNGSLDTSFGTAGKAVIHVGEADSSAKATLIMPDGKIL